MAIGITGLLMLACVAGVRAQTDIPRPIQPSPTAPEMVSEPAPEDKWGPPLPEDWEASDPVIRSGLGFAFENYLMPSAKVAPIEPLAPVSSTAA